MTDFDKPREACGIFGICGHPEAAPITYFGLYALQHRGQEAAGMAVSDGTEIVVQKDSGLVASVFDDHSLASQQHPGWVFYMSDGTWAWAWPELDLMILYFTQTKGGATGLQLETAIAMLASGLVVLLVYARRRSRPTYRSSRARDRPGARRNCNGKYRLAALRWCPCE